MPAESFFVKGILAAVNNRPYIQLSNEQGMFAQLTMAEARQIAYDMLVICSRAEADAMIVRFFEQKEFPPGAAGSLLTGFRHFRAELDSEPVGHTVLDPDQTPENKSPQA